MDGWASSAGGSGERMRVEKVIDRRLRTPGALRFDWVTNIPAPYRNHAFERMHALFPEYGIDFRVVFMAWSEPRRFWRFSPDELRYPWRLYRGLHPRLGDTALHFNPGLLADLRLNPPDIVMVGGWASPTHVLAPYFLPSSTVKILGCESHPDSVMRRSTWARWVKCQVVRQYDAFLVPQSCSLELLHDLDRSSRDKPSLLFPNIIDASVFREGVAVARAKRDQIRFQLGIENDQQLWFCPARLAEEKGLRTFFEAMRGLTNVRLLVAGEGPQRAELEALIAHQALPVHLLGQQTETQMVELYAAADWFVLPSLRDPSPLSAVEACAAGLPLLVSRRIGNLREVLEEDVNGFGFDPAADMATKSLLRQVTQHSPADRNEMGRASLRRYHQHFASDACVQRLANDILRLVSHRKPSPMISKTVSMS